MVPKREGVHNGEHFLHSPSAPGDALQLPGRLSRRGAHEALKKRISREDAPLHVHAHIQCAADSGSGSNGIGRASFRNSTPRCGTGTPPDDGFRQFLPGQGCRTGLLVHQFPAESPRTARWWCLPEDSPSGFPPGCARTSCFGGKFGGIGPQQCPGDHVPVGVKQQGAVVKDPPRCTRGATPETFFPSTRMSFRPEDPPQRPRTPVRGTPAG